MTTGSGNRIKFILAKDYLNNYLPGPLLKRIDLDSLEISKDSFGEKAAVAGHYPYGVLSRQEEMVRRAAVVSSFFKQ